MSRAIATTILRKIFGLTILFGGEVDLRELRDPVDELRDFDAEFFGQLVGGGERVLHHVVQKAGANAGGVEPQVRQDAGDTDGMHDVRLARLAGLTRVHPVAVIVRSLDEVRVNRRLVRLDAIDEVFGLEHRRRRAKKRAAA